MCNVPVGSRTSLTATLTTTQRQSSSDKPVNLFDTLVSNDAGEEVIGLAHETPVLLPRHSTFLLSDVTRLQPLLAGCSDGGYHCIVLDPPWENKSAKRGAKYPTLPSRRLLSIPIKQLLHQEGLVAMWITNRERHRRFVDQELFPAWGLQAIGEWAWIKVTNSGQLVSPLDVAHRRPYEVLILAQPKGTTASTSPPASDSGQDGQQPPPAAEQHVTSQVPQPQLEHGPNGAVGGPAPLPRHFCIFAVPGEHSRKPQLARLLRPYLPANARCLEMFARELTAHWTSWGNEALHFQQLHRFVLPASRL
ncbi:hypothetical protein WJX72_005400 [[Myrmecia] bisecta]|uniref:Uncharacterized protein n=1 Tax=[Myrmecia] bisecta TaxID=41462 RepID=A0AAW1QQK8_9CHLO